MFQTFTPLIVLGSAAYLKTEFTSREVVQLTGISARQLQWWDERGIVVPARQGRRRLYSV